MQYASLLVSCRASSALSLAQRPSVKLGDGNVRNQLLQRDFPVLAVLHAACNRSQINDHISGHIPALTPQVYLQMSKQSYERRLKLVMPRSNPPDKYLQLNACFCRRRLMTGMRAMAVLRGLSPDNPPVT